MIALTVALAALVGVALGLLGGGGSILAVPLLAYVAGLDAQHAIAMSLLVVGVTSAVGAVTHARAGHVRWRVAATFGLAAMTGAYAGGRVAHLVPGAVLLIGFAVVMIAAGIAMLRGRPGASATEAAGVPLARLALLGVGVGVVSGLVGAGGGFLLVPALALVAGLPMPAAVGTSLVVISVQSFAGLAGHLSTEHIDWRLAAMVTAAAVVGAVAGGLLVPLVDPLTLRRGFGWMVLAIASVMLYRESQPLIGIAIGGITLTAAVVSLVCARYGRCPLRRLGGVFRRLHATTA